MAGLLRALITATLDLAEREKATMELVVSGTDNAITMLEGNAQQVPEEEMLQAILTSQKRIPLPRSLTLWRRSLTRPVV